MKFYRNFANMFENVEKWFKILNLEFLKFLPKCIEFWQNFDRTLMWTVRMVRPLAYRTFQLRSVERSAIITLYLFYPLLMNHMLVIATCDRYGDESRLREDMNVAGCRFSSKICRICSRQYLTSEKINKSGNIATFWRVFLWNSEIEAVRFSWFSDWSPKVQKCVKDACKSCRSRQELSNEYWVAKFGFDTAANEPLKVCQKLARS